MPSTRDGKEVKRRGEQLLESRKVGSNDKDRGICLDSKWDNRVEKYYL